jgi:hypothetical protein
MRKNWCGKKIMVPDYIRTQEKNIVLEFIFMPSRRNIQGI